MKYIIMCAGNGKRWGNYLGIPKHFVKINGETLIGRTTRLLKEYGVNDYIITTSDERYKEYGEIRPQTHNDCEVDRFEDVDEKEICYLYGDVYYTENALKTIINTPTDEILFFGSDMEIFGVKIVNKDLFMKHKNKVKELFLNGKIDRCLGWEVYKSINGLPLNEYAITDRFYLINDGTDDIDCPKNYWDFVYKLEGGIHMVKCEVIENFTLAKFDELKNIERLGGGKGNFLKVHDRFECTDEMAKYLTGDNDLKKVVVKVLEVIPNEEVKEELPTTEEIDKAYEEINKPKSKKKKSKK